MNISCFFPPETLEPLPALTPVSRAWLSSEAGVEAETASEAARSPAVAEAVGRAVERANDAAAESNAHRIKKFAILEKGEDKQSFGGSGSNDSSNKNNKNIGKTYCSNCNNNSFSSSNNNNYDSSSNNGKPAMTIIIQQV